MNEKNEIKGQYDRRAEAIGQDSNKIKNFHTAISPVMKYFRNRKIETALALGGFNKGSRILEVGSNMGQYTVLLAEKGFQVTGSDISGKAIELGKKMAKTMDLKNIEYVEADAEDLGRFASESFDGVVSFSTLRYVPNLNNALQEIYRVTKRKGAVALDFPNKHCPWFRILKNKFGVENHIHDNFYSAKEIERLFEKAGFSEIRSRKIMFTHYTFPPFFLKAYRIMDTIAENTPLIKESAAIIVCKGVRT